MEEGARGGAHDLGVVEVDGAPGEHHRIRTRGVGGPDDRARVAGVAHLLEDRDQPWTVREDVAHRCRELPAHGHEALRGHRVGHGVEHVLGHELDIDTGLDSRLGDVAVPLERGRRRVQLDQELRPEGQCLGDGLRPLQQKKPGLRPGRPLRQFRHGTNAR